jgi:hypothetical protein
VTFSGAAAQRISVYLSQTGTLTNNCNALPIVNPDGTNLTNTGECGPKYFTDVLVLPATGTYTIKYNPGGMGTGTATFNVYAVPPDVTATLATDGTATSVTTTVPGQNAVLTFNGLANQSASFSLTQNGSLTSNCNGIVIVKPDGTNLVSTSGCGASWSGSYTLPSSGGYTVKFDPYDIHTGTATFSLTTH